MKRIRFLFLWCGLLVFVGGCAVGWRGVSEVERAIQRYIHRLERRYGIRVYYRRRPKASWRIGFRCAGRGDYPVLLDYIKLFYKEFRVYPPCFIREIHLRKVFIGKGLKVSNQRRAAMPDYRQRMMVYDFEYGRGDRRYQRHVVHHELFHFIDYRYHGSYYYKDPRWMVLNPKGFRYGRGGRYMRGGNAYTYSHPLVGFLNLYSSSGLEEDKAEVYATLFIPWEYRKARGWIEGGDIYLGRKFRFIKRFLRKKCAKMGEKFWRRILEAGSRSGGKKRKKAA